VLGSVFAKTIEMVPSPLRSMREGAAVPATVNSPRASSSTPDAAKPFAP
jgi:hypothetical protein